MGGKEPNIPAITRCHPSLFRLRTWRDVKVTNNICHPEASEASRRACPERSRRNLRLRLSLPLQLHVLRRHSYSSASKRKNPHLAVCDFTPRLKICQALKRSNLHKTHQFAVAE